MTTILLTILGSILVGVGIGFIPVAKDKLEEWREARKSPAKLVAEAQKTLGKEARVFAVPGSTSISQGEAEVVGLLWYKNGDQRSLREAATQLRVHTATTQEETLKLVKDDLTAHAAASDNLDVTVALLALAKSYDRPDDDF